LPILHAQPDTPEEFYTGVHCRTRCCIERSFGLLKARWRCLLRHRCLHYNPERSALIINACAVLHNIAIDARLPDPEPLTEEEAAADMAMEAGDMQPNPINIELNFLGHARAVREQVVRRLWTQR
jgi:DDE superfamily endonuclease